MIKACVIGFPIKHSRSPLIHGHWLNILGIEGNYERIEVSPDSLAAFLGDLARNGYAGCNITLPHKERAAALVDHVDDRVTRTGSVNTVYVRDYETWATSTDGEGFVENINWRVPEFEFAGKTATVMGAGGSARAIVDELLRRDVENVILANRTLERASAIADVFGERVLAIPFPAISQYLPKTDLLVNTTSAGIVDQQSLEIPLEHLPEHAIVTDINYVPLLTPFLLQAISQGLTIVPGLGMLLHQAVKGFEIWFGIRPTVTEDLYDLIARDIDPGYRR